MDNRDWARTLEKFRVALRKSDFSITQLLSQPQLRPDEIKFAKTLQRYIHDSNRYADGLRATHSVSRTAAVRKMHRRTQKIGKGIETLDAKWRLRRLS